MSEALRLTALLAEAQKIAVDLELGTRAITERIRRTAEAHVGLQDAANALQDRVTALEGAVSDEVDTAAELRKKLRVMTEILLSLALDAQGGELRVTPANVDNLRLVLTRVGDEHVISVDDPDELPGDDGV